MYIYYIDTMKKLCKKYITTHVHSMRTPTEIKFKKKTHKISNKNIKPISSKAHSERLKKQSKHANIAHMDMLRTQFDDGVYRFYEVRNKLP